MLWAYAKLKEWNAQLFRCGNPAVGWWVVGGWLVRWMERYRECVWMGRYAMVGVDAEFCSMSLRIMPDSEDSGGKLD